MKSDTARLLALLISLIFLCGCAANHAPDQGNASSNVPNTEDNASDPGLSESGTDIPDESGKQEDEPDNSGTEDNTSEPPITAGTELDSTELKDWNDYFNKTENNGLLRFAYSDPVSDPMQLAPYLELLFYDLGDNESEISEEEFALLAQQDAWLELDTSRLTRSFVAEYLTEKFGVPTGELLTDPALGYYLPEYDAWYLIHGDTWYDWYDFDRGVRFEDGTVELYYSGSIAFFDENGMLDLTDGPMVVTLREANGKWRILSNVIVGETETAPGNLSAEELAAWEREFNEENDYETNGLLRFLYTDVQNDPEQIIPYLWLLFYDTHIGEPVDDEERELLEQRYTVPDIGLSRLLRGYAVIFLRDYFGLDQDTAEALMVDPRPAPSEYFLPERDSWYMAHGDTAYHAYDFDRGVRLDDKTIKLYYTVDFLDIVAEDGTRTYLTDVNMAVTICFEDPNWYVISNEIVSEPWNA